MKDTLTMQSARDGAAGLPLFLAAHGVVVDGSGRVLLVRRDDARTWAPPGGTLDPGELPTEAVVREMAEETGLEVMPARLTALYYARFYGLAYLVFGFRCLQKGGELRPSQETPRLGYFEPDRLPRRMLSFNRRHVQDGLVHARPEPILHAQRVSLRLRLAYRLVAPLIYRWFAVRRLLGGEPRYIPPPPWCVKVSVAVEDDRRRTLWARSEAADQWQLPKAVCRPGEPPWQTARRAVAARAPSTLADLALREVVLQDEAEMLLRFTARVAGDAIEEPGVQFIAGDQLPKSALPADGNWLERLPSLTAGVHFRRQEA
jgi:ADP-ribose pyrophosphatase YjhB (NUDIX family)